MRHASCHQWGLGALQQLVKSKTGPPTDEPVPNGFVANAPAGALRNHCDQAPHRYSHNDWGGRPPCNVAHVARERIWGSVRNRSGAHVPNDKKIQYIHLTSEFETFRISA